MRDLTPEQWRLVHQAEARGARSQGIEKTPEQCAKEQQAFLTNLRWRLIASGILEDLNLLPDCLLVLLGDICLLSRVDAEEKDQGEDLH